MSIWRVEPKEVGSAVANKARMDPAGAPALYFIVNEPSLGDRPAEPLVREAISGGVSVIQYRSKESSTRSMIATAADLVRRTRRHRVPLLINDRVDVALAVGAEGAHLGAEDMPIELARRLLGPAATIGATVRTPGEARRAVEEGASYVAVGSIFASPTKGSAPVVGLAGLTAVREAVDVPVCAIGGIDADNVAEVVGAGADLVCVVSAIGEADRPGDAAAALVAAIAEAWDGAP